MPQPTTGHLDAETLLPEQFQEAMNHTKESLNLSSSEQQKFSSALKDPKFCQMLSDYMEEISDPKHREEQEKYLKQLEQEQKLPQDKEIFIPTPSFVLKLKTKTTKLFLNICHSQKIQPPSSSLACDVQKGEDDEAPGQGQHWQLPYSIGPQRLEKDKHGNSVPTFDICYHTETLTRAASSSQFRKMVIQTAIEGVQSVVPSNTGTLNKDGTLTCVPRSTIFSNTSHGIEYHVIRGIQYKSGKPVTMCISKPKPSPARTSKATSAKELVQPTAAAAPIATSVPAPKITEISSTVVPDASTNAPVSKRKNEERTKLKCPIYHIVYRGKFELAEYMDKQSAAMAKEFNRPKELVVKIDLPKHQSAKGMDLDVSSKMIKLLVPSYELLEVMLPFEVLESKGNAKFDKQRHQLHIILPVCPPEPSSCIPFVEEPSTSPCEEQEEECTPVQEEPTKEKTETLDHLRRMKKKEDVIAAKPTEEDQFFRALHENAAMIQEERETKAVLKKQHQVREEQDKRQVPKYEFQQTFHTVSLFIQIPDINAKTLQASFKSRTMKLSFETTPLNDSAVDKYELECIDSLYGKIDPEKSKTEIATQNMVIVLYKTTEEMWPSLTSTREVQQTVLKKEDTNVEENPAETTTVVVETEEPVPRMTFQNDLMYELD